MAALAVVVAWSAPAHETSPAKGDLVVPDEVGFGSGHFGWNFLLEKNMVFLKQNFVVVVVIGWAQVPCGHLRSGSIFYLPSPGTRVTSGITSDSMHAFPPTDRWITVRELAKCVSVVIGLIVG